ncbi:MAG: NADH-quinone oxidoreductase subunit N [Candidatus Omnitrophica bacterium]|nr:NADH-quinone oxidoreductase subunit N [Candidatus Omnitrophota bacterium]
MVVPALLESLRVWLPELVLSLGAMAAMLAAPTAVGAAAGRRAALATWAALLLAADALWQVQGLPSGAYFSGLITVDALGHLFRWLALGVIALVVLMVVSSSDVSRGWVGEYLGLLLCVGVGLMAMAQANHLLMAYLSIELVSLSSYALVALVRDARSSEAALKYLLFGALASGVMLFGMSLLYGMTGELSLPGLQGALRTLDASSAGALALALTLILAGLAFKISMVPFHMWTPDVYEGAPVPVAAMLSVGPKAAGLALLLRFAQALSPAWEALGPMLAVLTVLTMTLGNVVAVVQQNVKRLLAYSTIGQVGYLLIGLSVRTTVGLEAIFVYLVAYLFMNLGAFACVTAVCNESRDESLDAFRGLSRRAPALAALLTVFLLSLAGIPPLLGFLGKFLLFGSAIEASRVWLAVAGVVNSAIALYYYVNIIRQMYLLAPERAGVLQAAWPLRLAVGVCGLATVGLGLFPGSLLEWLRAVAAATRL